MLGKGTDGTNTGLAQDGRGMAEATSRGGRLPTAGLSPDAPEDSLDAERKRTGLRGGRASRSLANQDGALSW